MSLSDFLEQSYFENTLMQYLIFAGIILFGLLFKAIISKLISGILYNFFKNQFKSVGVKQFTQLLQKPFNYFIVLITVYIAFQQLTFPGVWHLAPENEFGLKKILKLLFKSALVVSLSWVFIRGVTYFGLVLKHRASLTDSKMDDQLVPFITEAIKIIFVVLSVFFILGNIFEINITALIGGAGIAGLAIALAAQETLGNLLGSFTIFLDKPFSIGDAVKVGNVHGVVETIGFRSTRIRTLERSIVTVPNKKMVDAELDNLTERELYRGRIIIGFRYDSPAEHLRNFKNDLKFYLDEHPSLDEHGLVRFNDMAPSSLEFLVLFFVKTREVEVFRRIKEEVLFTAMELANKNNLHFAFPSTSVYMEEKKIL